MIVFFSCNHRENIVRCRGIEHIYIKGGVLYGRIYDIYYCTCNYISASCTLRCKNRTTGVCNGY